MAYSTRNPNINKQLFTLLFIPSWLSLVVCLLLSILISVGSMIIDSYKSSTFKVDFTTYASTSHFTFHISNSKFFSNPIISNLPLIAFWTVVGFIVYLFAINVFRAIGSTAELKDELNYVNANQHDLLWSAAEQLIVHVLVLVVGIVYLLIFVHEILPYAINLALVGSGEAGILLRAIYVILSIFILAVAMHVIVVLVRLFLLRPRIFSKAVYVD